jgi:hypothetical protein
MITGLLLIDSSKAMRIMVNKTLPIILYIKPKLTAISLVKQLIPISKMNIIALKTQTNTRDMRCLMFGNANAEIKEITSRRIEADR